MTALHRIADDYPVATGSVGGGATLLTWLIERMISLSPILAFVAQVLGICIAVCTLYLLGCRIYDRHQARKAPFREPLDVDDDIPL